MKLDIKLGATSNIMQVFIRDSSSTTGAGLTGLTNASSGLTGYYHRDTDTTATAISIVSMTVGTFTSGGFKEIDSANMPGWYQFCPPDACFASGAKNVGIHMKGVTNMAPLPFEIQLVAYDPQDSVRMGMTALPNAAAAASGGVPVLGANATAISFTGGMTISNASGDALALSSSGGNGAGMNVSGNGSGAGIKSTGGATGRGIHALGGATSGAGFRAEGQGGNANGIHGLGFGTGSGLMGDGGATGPGGKFNGGATSGPGLSIATTSGDGISVLPTAGSALVLTADGTSKHGAIITGGTAGTSDGVKAVAGTGGVDIRGAITGNVTGNLSGSVGSVTVVSDKTGYSLAASQLFIKKNTALSNFMFVMTDSTTHAPSAGLTVTATRSIDGGAFAACANAVSGISSGVYKIDLAAADVDGTVITLRFTAAAADDRLLTIVTQT